VTPVLEVRGLVKCYAATPVLRGVDLTVEEHRVVTLIGSSGSGKSTLLRCVALLEEVDDGQVLLDGVDVTDPRADAAAAQRRMAIVFQAFNLFPHMTVLQNVTLAPRVVHDMSAAEADKRAHDLLRRVGLTAFAGAHPDRLSGGQQQRVAIARALAVQPRLLPLDEITSALDPELVRGGARDRAGACCVRDHDPHGHPRDGLRAAGGRPGVLPRRWPCTGVRTTRAGAGRPGARAHPAIPGAPGRGGSPRLTTARVPRVRGTGRRPQQVCDRERR
jgi:polar amino acid transport system ATP-binding protein